MEPITNIQAERYFVSFGMREQGGHFVKKLGELIAHADNINLRKIKEAFSGYWNEYLKIGKMLEERIKKEREAKAEPIAEEKVEESVEEPDPDDGFKLNLPEKL